MKNIGNIVIAVVAVAVIGAGVVLAGYFTDWFGLAKQTTLFLSIDGETLENGASGVTVTNGSEIIITSDKEYTVTVKAHSTESNGFEFYIGSELYVWKDLDGRDVSSAFKFNDNVISYGSMHEIIQTVVPEYTVFVSTAPESAADLFELAVTSGNSSVSIFFTVEKFEVDDGEPPEPPKPGTDVTVELDPDHIVF